MPYCFRYTRVNKRHPHELQYGVILWATDLLLIKNSLYPCCCDGNALLLLNTIAQANILHTLAKTLCFFSKKTLICK